MPNAIFRLRRPSASLSDYILYFWETRGGPDTAPPSQELLLPNGSVELAFRLGDPLIATSLPAYVVGPHDRAVPARPLATTHVFGVTFRPGRAFPILQVPIARLRNGIVPLRELWPLTGREIEDRVQDTTCFSDRVGIVREMLLHLAHEQHPDTNRAVDACVRKIFLSHGRVRSHRLAGTLSMPRRSLGRLFERHVGLPPKLLSRLVRFHTAVGMLQDRGLSDWPSVICNLGYYDQSHLIREFRNLCGRTPTEYFAARHSVASNFRICKTGAGIEPESRTEH